MGCFKGIFQTHSSRKHIRTKSIPTMMPMHDDTPPLSPSATFVEKPSRAPSIAPSHTCGCCSSMNIPSDASTIAAKHREKRPSYSELDEIYRPDVLETIEAKIDELKLSLEKLSLDIWENPEVAYEEKYAHKVLTEYMQEKGFKVTQHYLGLETAWKAEFTHGKNGRVIGVNSEMDALPGIGHACGHNLIAIAGVAVAIAIQAALQTHDIAGTIILLGTPAEEHGGGKIHLMREGAYDKMAACVMSHPGPGKPNGALIAPWLALQHIEVEFKGQSAHAGFMPWEGHNALDAAFLAYSGVSVLRQQMKPSCRVHGVVSGKDWEPNVIPDYAKMRWIIRAPTYTELVQLRDRVIACFEAAAKATACEHTITCSSEYRDVRENSVLGADFCKIIETQYDMVSTTVTEAMGASTDFGNVSYEIPSLHPAYTIPVQPKGGNHTREFTGSAREPAAHEACFKVSKALAMTGFRVVADQTFYEEVKRAFEESKALN